MITTSGPRPVMMVESGGQSMFRTLVRQNRSYRRFREDTEISWDTLRELVDLARMSPSAGNLQPLKYYLSCTPRQNSRIFDNVNWAGYIQDWSGPAPGRRPSAYIVILGDTEITQNFGIDHGIAAQTIMLGAVERGLGGCMMSRFDARALHRELEITDRYAILLVLALGEPREKVVLEQIRSDRDIVYWRDSMGHHHVPKRPLDALIINQVDGAGGPSSNPNDPHEEQPEADL